MMQALLDRIGRVAAALPLAITLLLFLQWPLRDLGLGGSTQANDLAQWMFALYVAAAVAQAQRRGSHLVARPDLATRPERRAGAALCVLPWSFYLVFASWPQLRQSVQHWEHFAETANPGYFMIKIALALLGLLLGLQALADLAALVALRRRRVP